VPGGSTLNYLLYHYESVPSMKLRLLLPGLAALVLLFAACSPPPPLRDDTLLHDTSLTDPDENCATANTTSAEPEATEEAAADTSAESTPEVSASDEASTFGVSCWRGIIPGQTAWGDALTMLEDDTTLENVKVQESEDSPAKAAEFQPKGGTVCCQIFTQDGEKVSVIFLRVAPTVSLGDLIEVHGDPTYLVGSQYSEDQAVMNLIFPEESLVVYAFVPGTTGALSESSEIVGILYLTPSDMDLLIKTSNLHVWDGFKSYTDYDTSEFEVTPEITLTPTPGS
jgi:hypothetical protein